VCFRDKKLSVSLCVFVHNFEVVAEGRPMKVGPHRPGPHPPTGHVEMKT
jgi:hypothetical protein